MVIEFDLGRTYGQQNEDISKKNKYNAVIVDVISNVESGDSAEGINLDFNTTSDNNLTFTKTIVKDGNWQKGNWAWEKCTVRNPVFKATISYKTYTITLSKTEYPQFAYLSQVPSFSSSFDGVYKEENSTQRVVINTDGFSAFKQYFENLTLSSPVFSGANPTITDYSFTNDIYTIEIPDDPSTEEIESSEQKNIMTEISSFIQQAISNTQTSMKEILDYINPKITNIANKTDSVTFTIQAPYKIQTYQSTDCGCLDKTWLEGKFYGEINSYYYREYTISSVNIDIFVGIDTESSQVKFHDGNREYQADQSFMFNDTNYMYYNKGKQYASWFSDYIVESYKNGKMTLKIKYPVGEIHDSSGGNVVYIDGYGIAREVSGNYFGRDGEQIFVKAGTKVSYNVPLEQGLLCIITNNGELVYKNPNGSAKYFLIQNVNFNYSGVATNEITAVESSSTPAHYVVVYDQPEHSKIWAENYFQGKIPSGGIIKSNYVEIFAEFDEGWGLAGNLMNINGQDVPSQILGLKTGWQIFPTSDVIVKPNVIYLGGKYLHISKDDDCTVNVSASPVSGSGSYYSVEDGSEIFTNQTLIISGKVNSNITPKITINGVNQTVTPYAQYDFYITYKVTDKDVDIKVQTTSLAKTLTINVDDEEAFYPDSPFCTINNSIYNPNSIGQNVYNGGTLYLGDEIAIYGHGVTLKTGYNLASYSFEGLEEISATYGTYKVVDNVVATYTTTLQPVNCTLYFFNNSISFSWNDYERVLTTVTRIESKAGGELGEIESYYGQLSIRENGELITRPYTGYKVLVGDIISISFEGQDPYTGEFAPVGSATITLSKGTSLTPTESITLENGENFKTTTTSYTVTAKIE